MVSALPQFDWVKILQWQTAGLVGFNRPGLFRFLWNGELMFMGYATSSKPGLYGRIRAHQRGGTRGQVAGQKIYEHRALLELQVAYLDLSEREIRDLCHALIDRDRPTWNVPHRYRGRC